MAREMRNSGVRWIGDIPSNWSVKQAKYNFENHKYIPGAQSGLYERLALTLKGVIRRSKDDAEGLQPKDFLTYQLLQKGELVFKLIDLQNVSTSRVGLSPYTGLVSPAYIILRANGEVISEFAEKYFLMLWHRQIFNALGDDGIRSNLSANDLLNIPICYPPLSEQKAIADFLDAKCGEIDGLLSDLDAEIKTLAEYKKSLIAETVTRGLNPNVPMKQINLGWIDEVPGNWSIARIASLYTVRNEKVSDQDFMPLSVTMRGIVPQLDNAAKTKHGDDRKLIRKGDFVINSRSDRRGSCGISPYDGSCSLINTVLAPREAMNPEYYDWLFHTTIFADEFYKWGYGIVNDLWTTNWGAMRRIQIPVPPIQEQAEIAAFLNKKIPQLNKTIADKTTQIETLKAYKSSLIYEYITGKKQVAL